MAKQEYWTEFTFELHQSAVGPRRQTLPRMVNKVGEGLGEARQWS